MSGIFKGVDFFKMLFDPLGLFKKAEKPTDVSVTPPSNAEADAIAAEQIAETVRQRRGRASNITTSPIGLSGLGSTNNSLGS